MNSAKKARLEAAGWKVGRAAEFLELNKEEAAFVEMELKTLAAGREPAAAMSSEPSWIISGMASRNSPAANLATGLSVGTTQRASLRMIGLVRLKMGPVIATNGVGHEILQHPRVVGMGGLRFQVGHRLDSREVEQPMATKRDRSLCARGN